MSGFQRSVMMAMGGGIDITTTSDAENVNLRTLLDAAGFDNDVPTKITYRLNSGVTLTSKAAGTNQEGPAWQTGTIGSIHTVIVYISGDIKGYGGVGGSGGHLDNNGSAGGTGGDAMSFACNATLVVNSGASVLAGGGGGGGGGGSFKGTDYGEEGEQGGSGGRGAGTNAAENGQAGGGSSGGEGGLAGAGGNGGAYGAAGSTGQSFQSGDGGGSGGAGGAAGYAVKKNSNTVSVTNNGTITGTQG